MREAIRFKLDTLSHTNVEALDKFGLQNTLDIRNHLIKEKNELTWSTHVLYLTGQDACGTMHAEDVPNTQTLVVQATSSTQRSARHFTHGIWSLHLLLSVYTLALKVIRCK